MLRVSVFKKLSTIVRVSVFRLNHLSMVYMEDVAWKHLLCDEYAQMKIIDS